MAFRLVILSLLLSLCLNSSAQLINHYWSQNFNSLSSLIGGAVVAGDGDNSSIYYNPATIIEMQQGSNVSVAANLFTWNIYRNYNSLGTGNNLSSTNFQVQPQFASYSYKPPKGNVSYAATILTRMKEDLETDYANSEEIDLIKSLPGSELYNTAFSYRNKYVDTWVGFGFGHKLNDHFSYGATLFVSASTLIYQMGYNATVYSYSDSTINGVSPSLISQSVYSETIKFYQYRLISKIGVAYELNNWRFGLVVTLPSVNVFTSGRSASRSQLQTNIRDTTGQRIPDFQIFSFQEKSQLKANFKYPFAAAFGFIGTFNQGDEKLYFSMEYFNGIKPYSMISAEINPSITSPSVYESLPNKDYLSYYYMADQVLNVAIGYSWKLKQNLKFVNAFRTDFTFLNEIDSEELGGYNYMKTSNFNIYHYSAGLNFNFKKNNVIAGGQFSFGYKNDVPQIANFNNPMEYDPDSGNALQGPVQNNAYTRYYGVSIYISATLNFISKKNQE
jgi:hypothetical protein